MPKLPQMKRRVNRHATCTTLVSVSDLAPVIAVRYPDNALTAAGRPTNAFINLPWTGTVDLTMIMRRTQDVELPGRHDGLGALRLHEHCLHLLHTPAYHRSQPARHCADRRACDVARSASAMNDCCKLWWGIYQGVRC